MSSIDTIGNGETTVECNIELGISVSSGATIGLGNGMSSSQGFACTEFSFPGLCSESEPIAMKTDRRDILTDVTNCGNGRRLSGPEVLDTPEDGHDIEGTQIEGDSEEATSSGGGAQDRRPLLPMLVLDHDNNEKRRGVKRRHIA